MRSLYVRLLFAIAGTLTLASAGFLVVFFSISRPVIEGVFGRFYALNTAEAVESLCWLLSRGIVSPIREIAGIVTDFGGGQLGARARVTRSDEIGKLAGA